MTKIKFRSHYYISEKAMATHSSTLAWKIPRRRSLVGCSPRGCKESDTTELLHFHFSLSQIGEGNGNPLQCSCLENPRDGGAWWAAISGVAQSRTRLKQLSSSSRTKGKNPSSEGMVSLLPVGQVTGFDPFSSTISFNLHTTLTFLLLSPFYR